MMGGDQSVSTRTIAVTALLVVAALLSGCTFGQTGQTRAELPSSENVEANVDSLKGMTGTIEATSTAWTTPRRYHTRVNFSTSNVVVKRFVTWPAADSLKVYVGQTPTFYIDEDGDPLTEWNTSAIAYYRSNAPAVFQSLRSAQMGEHIDPGLPVPVIPESAKAALNATYLGRDSVSGREAYAVRMNTNSPAVVNRTVWYDAEWFIPVQWYTNATAVGTNTTYQQSLHRLENVSFSAEQVEK